MNFKRYHVSKNLYDGTLVQGAVTDAGFLINSATRVRGEYIPVQPNVQYTLSTDQSIKCIYAYNNQERVELIFSIGTTGGHERTFTTPDNCNSICIAIMSNEGVNTDITPQDVGWVMLNTGSTPLPYEPYSSEVWHDIPYYIHNTATDTLTLPAVIYPNDTSITVGIKGNTTQSGTPTPSSPVDVNGVGERTAQLFDFDTWANNVYIVRGTKVVSGNSITITSTGATCFTGWNNTEYPAAVRIPVTEGETIHLTWDTDAHDGSAVWIFPNASATNEVHTVARNKSLDYTVASGVDYITFRLDVATANKTITYSNIMFNSGSTAKPYEPWGFKIPISNGSTTTPIYLGSTASIRQIQKLVLTGQENDWIYQSDYTRFLLTVSDVKQFVVRTAPMYSTHYQVIDDGRPIADVPNNSVYFNNHYLCITTSDYTSTTDFKAFLAAQYSAGTPVEVYYILETATTAAVNEPLMKIGDYADTLSNATAIPTTDGANSITVDTTVQPSEFTATWTGWHDSSVKEYDGSDWN